MEEPPGLAKEILCVEDDADTCDLLTVVLESCGYKVTVAASAAEGLELAKSGRFALVMLDTWLPFTNGVDLCKKIRRLNSAIPILFYSGAAYPDDIEAGLGAGANEYLSKPCELDDLVGTIDRLVAPLVGSGNPIRSRPLKRPADSLLARQN